jgi:hypothetical protein
MQLQPRGVVPCQATLPPGKGSSATPDPCYLRWSSKTKTNMFVVESSSFEVCQKHWSTGRLSRSLGIAALVSAH